MKYIQRLTLVINLIAISIGIYAIYKVHKIKNSYNRALVSDSGYIIIDSITTELDMPKDMVFKDTAFIVPLKTKHHKVKVTKDGKLLETPVWPWNKMPKRWIEPVDEDSNLYRPDSAGYKWIPRFGLNGKWDGLYMNDCMMDSTIKALIHQADSLEKEAIFPRQ